MKIKRNKNKSKAWIGKRKNKEKRQHDERTGKREGKASGK
jgi:hypothetical protein